MVFIIIAIIQLMSINSAFSCDFTPASLLKSVSTSFTEYKEKIGATLTANEEGHCKTKHTTPHCEDHCKQCSTCGCFYIKPFNRVTSVPFVAFSTFYFELRFIYKSPFINFDNKPPIAA